MCSWPVVNMHACHTFDRLTFQQHDICSWLLINKLPSRWRYFLRGLLLDYMACVPTHLLTMHACHVFDMLTFQQRDMCSWLLINNLPSRWGCFFKGLLLEYKAYILHHLLLYTHAICLTCLALLNNVTCVPDYLLTTCLPGIGTFWDAYYSTTHWHCICSWSLVNILPCRHMHLLPVYQNSENDFSTGCLCSW